MLIDNTMAFQSDVSLSFASNSKKTSIKHNERRTKEDALKLVNKDSHINPDLTDENLVLVSKPIKRVYSEVFGEAVKAYNQKQRRKDRRIKDFYSKVWHSKNLDPQKEFIVQVGRKDEPLSADPKRNRDLQKQILTKYFKAFEQTYPQLHPYSASIHVDEEGAPHLHLCVVPEATGYKRGISKQPSFSKALGLKSVDDFKAFCEDNRKLLLDATNEVLGTDLKRRNVGTHTYQMPDEYRHLMAEANQKKEEAEEVLSDAQEQAKEIISRAETKAKTKSEVNAEVARYRENEMSKVDKEVVAYKQGKLSQVDREVKTYKSKVADEVKTYKVDEKNKADSDLKIYRASVKADIDSEKLDADQKLAEATQKFTEALAKENELNTRERDLADRELMLKNKQEALNEESQNLDDREEKLNRREKYLDHLENALKEKIDAFNEHMTKTFRQLGELTKEKLKKLNVWAHEQEQMQITLDDLNQHKDQQL